MYRIGYACKYMYEDQTLSRRELEEIQRPLNTKSTTLKWLRENKSEAHAKMYSVIWHNIDSIYNQMVYVAKLPDHLRMLRISSDILPFYTHVDWKSFYTPELMAAIERKLSIIGDCFRKNDIRVSFHPGQFTALASDRPEVVESSIAEIEYHADLLRMMGYCQTFQDAKCNVHIHGRNGVEGMLAAFDRLSVEAMRVLTIENDEISYGLDDVLQLSHRVPIVLDIHHHWVKTGEFIQPDDDRVIQVIDSWQGVRPTMHYSMSRKTVLATVDPETTPDYDHLLESGLTKRDLRAHSDTMWNAACNQWAYSFLESFDIMVEAKHKNLASVEFAKGALDYQKAIANSKTRFAYLVYVGDDGYEALIDVTDQKDEVRLLQTIKSPGNIPKSTREVRAMNMRVRFNSQRNINAYLFHTNMDYKTMSSLIEDEAFISDIPTVYKDAKVLI